MEFGNRPTNITAACQQLAHCTRLERLWWDVASDPERQRGSCISSPAPTALRDLISIVAAAAPRLTSIASPYQSPTSLTLSMAARQELDVRRQREANGPAWAVVRIGLERAQERRIRGSPSPTAGLVSPLCRLPSSVLRRLGDYLDAVPLPLTVVTNVPWLDSILYPYGDILERRL